MTTVIRWEHGLPAEWATETEPEWDPDTRNWAFALADLESDTCPHGHRLSESVHDGDQGSSIADWEPSYVACAACAAIEYAQDVQEAIDNGKPAERVTEKNVNKYPSARLWYAHKKSDD